MTVDKPVTLGMLDIDRFAMAVQGDAVTFDSGVPGIDAVLLDRKVNDTSTVGTTLAVPIILNSPLEVEIDSAGTCNAAGPISGPNGIVKEGNGNLALTSPNTFLGGLVVNGGTVTSGTDGALGNGTVVINNGVIDLQTPNPFGPGGGTIDVQSNGEVILENTSGNVNYNVATLGSVSGSAQQLESLVIGSNYFPTPGSMISHQTFDTTSGSGNPSGLPTVPTYVYGVSNDFTDAADSIIVGSNSNTPWNGFGSDTQSHTFGTLGNGQTLGIQGHASLVALGGVLTINAAVTGGTLDSISKSGAGLVVINSSSTFTGSTSVDAGQLAINGSWAGPITVSSGATLGGAGSTSSTLTFLAGSTFQPGVGAADSNANNMGSQPVTPTGQTLHSGSVTFSSTTHILYNLNTADIVGGAGQRSARGPGGINLNNAILDINGGVDFATGTYTLMEATGPITGTLTLADVPLDDFPGMQLEVVDTGADPAVLLSVSVPEPATVGLLARSAHGASQPPPPAITPSR